MRSLLSIAFVAADAAFVFAWRFISTATAQLLRSPVRKQRSPFFIHLQSIWIRLLHRHQLWIDGNNDSGVSASSDVTIRQKRVSFSEWDRQVFYWIEYVYFSSFYHPILGALHILKCASFECCLTVTWMVFHITKWCTQSEWWYQRHRKTSLRCASIETIIIVDETCVQNL